jgi:hypothetical protein
MLEVGGASRYPEHPERRQGPFLGVCDRGQTVADWLVLRRQEFLARAARVGRVVFTGVGSGTAVEGLGLTGVAFQEIAIGTTNGFVAHGIGANGVIAGSTVGSVTLNGDDVVARVLCLR